MPADASGAPPDPFGTADLRRVVLDAWSASPARFREDANAEDLLASGGYAGRALVELAANAVDAAREAGEPARVRIRLTGDELRIANTGAPLTAAGVAALASLRASAKRDRLDSVGFFGVGFTAVLSWSSAPRVVSATGSVRFDEGATRDAVRARSAPALTAELDTRGGHVPALRLPWPGPAEHPPAGYVTEVRLPLRASVRPEVAALLDDPDTVDDLLWALPALTEIDLVDRVVRRHESPDGTVVVDDVDGDRVRSRRYRTVTRTGEVPAELLSGRPVEQRTRSSWRIGWILPLDAPGGSEPNQHSGFAVGAPTPTDELLSLPARLVGTLPVDDTRRRLAAGPLCDHLLDRAADSYLDLVLEAPADERWALLPAAGFPAGPVDATLRAGILRRARTIPLLRSAAGDPVTGAQASLLPGVDADAAALIGEAIPGLLPPLPAAAGPVLRELGATTLTWAQVSTALAEIDRPPSFWRRIYQAAATAAPRPRPEDLADVPVPLVGGRRSLGARGCLRPARLDGVDDDGAGDRIGAGLADRIGAIVPGMRLVDPEAAHPLLDRLGARPAEPIALLADPALTDRVARLRADLDDVDVDPDEVVELGALVLDLLDAAGTAVEHAGADAVAVGRLLDELVLTADDGNPWPAAELLLPGAPLAEVLADDVEQVRVDQRWVRDYAPDLLQRAGVRYGFPVVRVAADDLDRDRLPELAEWADHALPEEAFAALADLDLVDDDRWARALELIAGDPRARGALAPTASGPSYGAWWIAGHARLAGRRPGQWRLAAATELDGLYDALPGRPDPTVARWIGVRTDLASVAADDPADLLDRLADPDRPMAAARVAPVTAAVVRALDGARDLDLPSGVRTGTGDVVDAGSACVLDEPWWVQVERPDRLVPGGPDPVAVARVLDLPAASVALAPATVEASGAAPAECGPAWRRAAAAVGVDPDGMALTVAPTLRVAAAGRDPVPVRWWVDDGRFYADGTPESLGRVAAWASGSWSRRHLATAAARADQNELAELGLDEI